MRNISGVIRTSAVLISAGKKGGVYRSVQEVPEPLRTQLILTTASQNSGTIVIADRAGKEQLTKVLAQRRNPGRARTRKTDQTMSAEEAAVLDELLQNLALSAENLSGEALSNENLLGEATSTQAFAGEEPATQALVRHPAAGEALPGKALTGKALPGKAMMGKVPGNARTAGGSARSESAMEAFSRRASWLAWAGLILVLFLAVVVSVLFGIRW